MISIRYTCNHCGLTDVIVRVPARESAHVDVKQYIEKIISPYIAKSHRYNSPGCGKSVVDIKIPIIKNEPGAWIGKQTDIVPPMGKL